MSEVKTITRTVYLDCNGHEHNTALSANEKNKRWEKARLLTIENKDKYQVGETWYEPVSTDSRLGYLPHFSSTDETIAWLTNRFNYRIRENVVIEIEGDWVRFDTGWRHRISDYYPDLNSHHSNMFKTMDEAMDAITSRRNKFASAISEAMNKKVTP